ncbi:hypothetical protein FOA52_014131 [Chlamydomonas sp. UWO 241]|nr:hypothetical protein FOA52_014131 [Chlamydomonas sp. UWO 241]
MWLQLRLWEDHSVRTLRRSLAQIAAEGTLDPSSKVLSLQTAAGRAPVSVVYFRAGYTPGAKKVQQDLAAPGVLESFAEVRCSAL